MPDEPYEWVIVSLLTYLNHPMSQATFESSFYVCPGMFPLQPPLGIAKATTPGNTEKSPSKFKRAVPTLRIRITGCLMNLFLQSKLFFFFSVF